MIDEKDIDLYGQYEYLKSFDYNGREFVVIAVPNEDGIVRQIALSLLRRSGEMWEPVLDPEATHIVPAENETAEEATIRALPIFNKFLAERYGSGEPRNFLEALVKIWSDDIVFDHGTLRFK